MRGLFSPSPKTYAGAQSVVKAHREAALVDARPASRVMISPGTCLSVLWLSWIVVWLVAARATPGTVVKRSVRARVVYFGLMSGSALLLILQPRRFGLLLLRPVLSDSRSIAWCGVFIVGTGLAFATWARVELGRFWSSAPSIKAEHDLIRTGPYALTRHPIYSGLLLAVATTTLLRGTIAALAGLGLFSVALMLKIHEEERLLVGHFGDAYRSYQAEVPAILPGFRIR
jgi:protein-S-isoprenylcysteine O-methyltransferase Ste14